MGRPKKRLSEIRNIQVLIKLNKNEQKYLQMLVLHAETNVSALIRQLIMKDRLIRPRRPKVDTETYLQLKRVGNLLNQYVRAVNQQKLDFIDRKILTLLQETLNDIEYKILQHDSEAKDTSGE